MKSIHTFQSEGISAGYDHTTILHDISISIPSNKISIIIGANGCGKSTLLKTMARPQITATGMEIRDRVITKAENTNQAKKAPME